MSRYSITQNDKQLIYGFDHIFAYFGYVVNPKFEQNDEANEKPIGDPDGYFMEGDPFTSCSRTWLIEKLKAFNAPKEHITAVLMDIPF